MVKIQKKYKNSKNHQNAKMQKRFLDTPIPGPACPGKRSLRALQSRRCVHNQYLLTNLASTDEVLGNTFLYLLVYIRVKGILYHSDHGQGRIKDFRDGGACSKPDTSTKKLNFLYEKK